MSFYGNFDNQIMNDLFCQKNGSLYLSFGTVSLFFCATQDFITRMVVSFLTRAPKSN
jgi:hypothetical protein